MEKPGEKNELARARRKRSGNNEEGESELKARKPSESNEGTGEKMSEKRSEKIIEDERKERKRKGEKG